MVTPVGFNTEMTAASVRAGISAYQTTEYYDRQRRPITMALIPDEFFYLLDYEIEEENPYSAQYDRVIKMSIYALKEALSHASIEQAVPLILTMPEPMNNVQHVPINLLIKNIAKHIESPNLSQKNRSIHTGRASGIQAIELALRYLYEAGEEFVLIGGGDSYMDYSRLNPLIESQRLLAPNASDGFAAGEGAAFLLLTNNPDKALRKNNHIVAINSPGIGEEPGNLHSDAPYRGDGLAQAFASALSGCAQGAVDTIYSSMNGEHYWAKEYGVAYIRNRHYFGDNVKVEHPADCYGDLGAATGNVLMGLVGYGHLNGKINNQSIIYSSSDSAWRAAVCMEIVKV
jgi:3-oxoacyl-[acyl-carrier-protein] synthase-1